MSVKLNDNKKLVDLMKEKILSVKIIAYRYGWNLGFLASNSSNKA